MKCERNPQYALMLATCFFNNSHRVPRVRIILECVTISYISIFNLKI